MARCVAAMDRLLPTSPDLTAVSHAQGLYVRIGAPVLLWNSNLFRCIWGAKLWLKIDAFVDITKKKTTAAVLFHVWRALRGNLWVKGRY